MIERHKVEEFIYSYLHKVKRKPNGGYNARCPVCGDSKKNPNMRRLHIDVYDKHNEWIYKCYNGGCPQPSGNIQSLYAHVCGVTWKEAHDEMRDREYDAKKIKARVTEPRKEWQDEVDEVRTNLDIDLNEEVYFHNSETDSRIGKRYMDVLRKFIVSRKIPLRYNIAVAHGGRYRNRLIIPVYEGDEMIYFQGRSIHDEQKPKYLNPDVLKEQIVLNLNLMDMELPIVVAEGLLCGMSVEGSQGTACLGSYPNDVFMRKIFHKYPKADVIIALDNPLTDESGYECYQKFIKKSPYAQKVRYFFMPNEVHKDLNDVRIAEGWKFNLLEFVDKNSHSFFKSSRKIQQGL
jgi:hypothetical protein